MIINDIAVLFGGQAGDGSLTTGDLIATAFKRMGLEVYTFKDFPSRIRGGHTNYVIRAGERRHYGVADFVDAMVAFDLECVEKHIEEMRPGGFVVFDNSSDKLTDAVRREDIFFYEVPLGKIAKEQLGLELVRNTISLGVLGEIVGMDPAIVRQLVTQQYERKGEKVVAQNIGAVEAGEQFVRQNFSRSSGYTLQARADGDRVLMMGNDAIGYGALVAGCRFMAGYPITPATDILEWMAKYGPEHGVLVVQAEDELAAINMVVGASYAGARAMTATSGPGQALMTEAIGLAGVVETPIVIVECARAGPSTGMPTKTEQSNLNHLIFSGHGEIPKVVLAPGTVEDSFYIAVDAFNLAERYQLPVFILTEQALCQSKEAIPRIKLDGVRVDRGKLQRDPVVFGEYKRFAFTDDGVSPRVIPGVEGGMHLEPGSEHNDAGVITENANNRSH
ncbi:MAG: 2-oxoacid:acceptor oxidoreductase subunit alpha, partial [Candidatus Eremiobacteraeota bacterium]|nr:2-oxoacid:acceptor oxidoreductase subunit alpha [Candidatus Eremiobacteraeota bacterium]